MESDEGRGLCLREGERANLDRRPEMGSFGGGSGASGALAISKTQDAANSAVP